MVELKILGQHFFYELLFYSGRCSALVEHKEVSVVGREREKHYEINLEEQIFAGAGC